MEFQSNIVNSSPIFSIGLEKVMIVGGLPEGFSGYKPVNLYPDPKSFNKFGWHEYPNYTSFEEKKKTIKPRGRTKSLP